MKIVELKCPNCGAKISHEKMNCEYCGTHILIEQPTQPKNPIEEIQKLFPNDLLDVLSFEEMGKFVNVKFPFGYFNKEQFTKVCLILRDAGGMYISAGTNSYFRVPITRE
jgi:DNA-directed RNA polymerase subunit RPC12/RpoP